ncbi:MAG: dihydroorotate dehydrogenase 2 [Nitrososphaerota archaeon]|nr:dihydroorotate dehydrogenase 2 [Nitrososphaerota archaeon]
MDGYRLAAPILFALDPEKAHSVGLSLMRFASKTRTEPSPVETSLGELANPLAIAAGSDKTGPHLRSLSRLGFGYLVAGTFTASPWSGNPRPRVARDRSEKTLVNALGFPNPGIDAFVLSLASQGQIGVPVVASVSGKTEAEVVACYSKVQPHVAGVELNLSSPNTPGLKDLREPAVFAELAQAVKAAKVKPTYLKIPPYVDEAQFGGVASLVRRWEDLGFEGVTASNSLPVEDPRMAVGRGGLSGPPLLERTKAAVSRIRRASSLSFEVNACGGVSSPADASSLLAIGATTVQLFTALVYQGPSLVRQILADPDFRLSSRTR